MIWVPSRGMTLSKDCEWRGSVINTYKDMIKYVLTRGITPKGLTGKTMPLYARAIVTENVDLTGLSKHMANHNSPYSAGVIKGVLTDMVSCIKELILEGKSVKIDDLAIFTAGIVNKRLPADERCTREEDYIVSKYVEGIKLRARGTGAFLRTNLSLDASLERAKAYSGMSGINKAEDETPGGSGGGESLGGSDGDSENPLA